jgi:hypothetical protein
MVNVIPTSGIKKIVNRLADKFNYVLYKKSIIINNNKYEWLTIPSPNECPVQSQTHPSICYVKNRWNGKSHWLATTPYPNGDVRFENPCIYNANAINGCPSVFTPILNNPIYNWQGGKSFNSDVELHFMDNTLFSMIKENYNGKFIREIKVQHSNNGTDWSAPIHVIASNEKDRQLLSPSIIQYKDKIRIYTLNYSGIGRKGNCSGIEIYEGTSLLVPDFQFISSGNFSNKNEIQIEPWHFDLFEYKSKLYMVLCAFDKRVNNFRNKMYTYLAVSDNYITFKIYKSPIVNFVRNYRPAAYIDENDNFVLLFSVIGDIYKTNADRVIGKTIFKMKELLEHLESKES